MPIKNGSMATTSKALKGMPLWRSACAWSSHPNLRVRMLGEVITKQHERAT